MQINIINKDEIDVKKSVVALMPNFIHSLDATNIHEITNYLYNLSIDEIEEEFKKENDGKGIIGEDLYKKIKEEYIVDNYLK